MPLWFAVSVAIPACGVVGIPWHGATMSDGYFGSSFLLM